MSEWEKFVVPDWVVEDRNCRLNGGGSSDNSPISSRFRKALNANDNGEALEEYFRKLRTTDIAVGMAIVERDRGKNVEEPITKPQTKTRKSATVPAIFVIVLFSVFLLLIFLNL